MQQALIAGGLTLAGVVIGWSLPVIYDWWKRPRLRLALDNPERSQTWSGHAIAVTNDGGQVAKNCHGMMTLNVTKDDLCANDRIVRLADLRIDTAKFGVTGKERFLLSQDNWRDVTNELVAWSQIGNPISIDIYPHTRPLLDICRYMNGPGHDPQLHFVSERGWSSLRGAFMVGDYEMTVTVGAENAAIVHRDYLIRSTGRDIKIVPKKPHKKDKIT